MSIVNRDHNKIMAKWYCSLCLIARCNFNGGNGGDGDLHLYPSEWIWILWSRFNVLTQLLVIRSMYQINIDISVSVVDTVFQLSYLFLDYFMFFLCCLSFLLCHYFNVCFLVLIQCLYHLFILTKIEKNSVVDNVAAWRCNHCSFFCSI